MQCCSVRSQRSRALNVSLIVIRRFSGARETRLVLTNRLGTAGWDVVCFEHTTISIEPYKHKTHILETHSNIHRNRLPGNFSLSPIILVPRALLSTQTSSSDGSGKLHLIVSNSDSGPPWIWDNYEHMCFYYALARSCALPIWKL